MRRETLKKEQDNWNLTLIATRVRCLLNVQMKRSAGNRESGEVHMGRPELALGGVRGFPAPKVNREDASLDQASRAL